MIWSLDRESDGDRPEWGRHAALEAGGWTQVTKPLTNQVRFSQTMLKKFVTIKNVSRFKNFSASGDIELKRLSLLFAENGRGKTTLCAVLRSLQSGVGAHVIGRTTLGSTDAPEIRILSDGRTFSFGSGAWNSTLPDIAIFDATFVSENVFSGDSVGIGHKRNLYRVIVGRDGVTLAKEIETLDEASRAKATDIREKTALIQAFFFERDGA